MNKKLLIGLGVVAAAGVAYYLWKRKSEEPKSNLVTAMDCNDPRWANNASCPKKAKKFEGKKKWSNAAGAICASDKSCGATYRCVKSRCTRYLQ